MFLEAPTDLIERLDLSGAVKTEVESPRSMLPSRVVESALEDHHDDYARAVRARLSAGLDIEVQESLWTPKPGPVGRYRWLMTLPIRERVILRALVMDLGDDVPVPDRSSAAFGEFQQAPVEDEHPYVTVADVASFYFFIDHQLLESRIVERSAKADTAETLRAVLASIGDRAYGLPQNFRPSDALSEIYISWVERRLARANVPTYRHNDDFRLGAPTWGDALRSLERLGEEVSAVGLELNGEKSWILSREKYEANLGIAQEIFEDAAGKNWPEVDPYTGEPIEPEDGGAVLGDDEMLRISEAVFEASATRRLSEERLTGFEFRAHRELLATALSVFRRLTSDAGLEYGPRLVAVEPALAHAYGLYLADLADADEGEETSTRVLDVLGHYGGHTPEWVQLWLMEPFLAPRAELNDDALKWLRGVIEKSDGPSVLRARAALALAVSGKVDVAELVQLFNELPSAAGPDLVAALAFLKPEASDPRVQAVTESEHLHRWIFEYAGSHDDDARWA